MFALRIVNVDHYQSSPIKGLDFAYSDFRGSETKKVPVIRIFGVTPAGQKACLHVHGYYPYITIPYDGSVGCDWNVDNNKVSQHVQKYMQELTFAIDKALNVAAGNSSSFAHHVYKITPFYGIPFYGYHEEKLLFFRIYFYNPHTANKVVELLHASIILDKFIQPYEAHIPYILQFFIDNNLYGMNVIYIQSFKFRISSSGESFISFSSPLNDRGSNLNTISNSSNVLYKLWNMHDLSNEMVLGISKQTTCELELDCQLDDIYNRTQSSRFSNPCLHSIWEEEKERQKERKKFCQLTPPVSQERHNAKKSESEKLYLKRLNLIIEKICHKQSDASGENIEADHSLNDTQDKDVLSMIFSIMNSQSNNLDNFEDDSILSTQKPKSDSSDDKDELEMSQCIWNDYSDILTNSSQSTSERSLMLSCVSGKDKLIESSKCSKGVVDLSLGNNTFNLSKEDDIVNIDNSTLSSVASISPQIMKNKRSITEDSVTRIVSKKVTLDNFHHEPKKSEYVITDTLRKHKIQSKGMKIDKTEAVIENAEHCAAMCKISPNNKKMKTVSNSVNMNQTPVSENISHDVNCKIGNVLCDNKLGCSRNNLLKNTALVPDFEITKRERIASPLKKSSFKCSSQHDDYSDSLLNLAYMSPVSDDDNKCSPPLCFSPGKNSVCSSNSQNVFIYSEDIKKTASLETSSTSTSTLKENTEICSQKTKCLSMDISAHHDDSCSQRLPIKIYDINCQPSPNLNILFEATENDSLDDSSKTLTPNQNNSYSLMSDNGSIDLLVDFNAISKKHIWTPLLKPPSFQDVASFYDVSIENYDNGHLNNSCKLTEKEVKIEKYNFKVNTSNFSSLKDFQGYFEENMLNMHQRALTSHLFENSSIQTSDDLCVAEMLNSVDFKVMLAGNKSVIITPAFPPPTRKDVERDLKMACAVEKNKFEIADQEVSSELRKFDSLLTKQNNHKESSLESIPAESNSQKLSCDSKNSVGETIASEISNHSKEFNESPNIDDDNLNFIEYTSPNISNSLPSHSTPMIFDKSNLTSDKVIKVGQQSTCKKALHFSCTIKGNQKKQLSLSPIISTISEDNLNDRGKFSKRKISLKKKRKGTKSNMYTSGNLQFPCKKKIRLSTKGNNHSISNRSPIISEIEGPTLDNTFGFCVGSQPVEDIHVGHEHQYLTVMSLEVHVETRNDLLPNPQYDPIAAIFYSIYNDVEEESRLNKKITGIVAVDKNLMTILDCASTQKTEPHVLLNDHNTKNILEMEMNKDVTNEDKHKEFSSNNNNSCHSKRDGFLKAPVLNVKNEIALLEELIKIVRKWDPDIFVGYEIQKQSWGYVVQRSMQLNMNFQNSLSRIVEIKNSNPLVTTKNSDETDHASEINIRGRIVLNVWRIMRKEINLTGYTYENIAFHVLHRRVPKFSYKTLTRWFKSDLDRWKVMDYYVSRVLGTIEMLEILDIISRTSELARLFGIQFYEVFSRGSQFRVESLMLRCAKPLNYVAVSPSVQQRSRMRSPEVIPLVLEPESKFYTNPVLVLDFQSLYPSMIMAYNYCFSTCLGKIEHFEKDAPFDFGCSVLRIMPSTLKELKEDVHISPSGVAFVKPHIRKGVLPQMLEEILSTRVMVKKTMKEYKDLKGLSKLLDARQLGLKLIANVTYGYTAASFSGRMPCVEIADSIVGKGRETLERAIALVEEVTKWQGRVVYGDTDSIFVLLETKSKDQAFKIGQEIAEAVTALNPKPVKLKFEKIYLPCILETKKRYVGYMYETIDQKEPVFDDKGIETVRRDSCPAVPQILKKSLQILFTTYNVDNVKWYMQKQFKKLMNGSASIQNYIFAKEYRGIDGYRPGARVPALEIARRLLRKDPRAEPLRGERVPYVIIYGPPGLRLIQLVRQPEDLFTDSSLRINAEYYITRVIIPPLERAFSLLGENIMKWYLELPHIFHVHFPANFTNQHKGTLSQYFASSKCITCEESTHQPLCKDCSRDSQFVTVVSGAKIKKYEQRNQQLSKLCWSCTGSMSKSNMCTSLDCPVLYRIYQIKKDLSQVSYIRDINSSLIEF